MTRLSLLLVLVAAVLPASTPPTPLPATGEWGFAVIGDPQYNTCAATAGASLADCTNWVSPSAAQAAVWPNQIAHILSQQSARSLQFALFVGDLTDQTTQIVYDTVTASFQQLKAAGLPIFAMPGNHDVYTNTGITAYNNMMATIYSGVPYVYGRFGKASLAGAESVSGGYQNIAYSLTINGRPLLVLCIEYAPTNGAMDWGKSVEAAWLTAHPRGRVWFATHDFGSASGSPFAIDAASVAQAINTYWLASDSNIEVVFCGHWNMQFAAKGALGPWTVVQEDTQNLGFGAGGDVGYYRVKQDGTVDGCVYMVATSSWAGNFFTSWPSGGCVTFGVQSWGGWMFPLPSPVAR